MDTLSFELTKWPKVPIPVTYLSTLYNDRSTSDFTIVLPRSQREIYVHKLILGSASGFFRGLFHSGMSDASDSSYTFQVEDHELSLDPDLAERAFGYVIQMLYTANFSCLRGEGDNDETNQENKDELQDSSARATIENQAEEAISKDLKVIFQMLFISNFLQIKDLISACSFVLSHSISEANCFYYFMLPPTEEMFELKKRAVEFFAENKRRSLLDTNLSHLSYEVLVGLLVSKPMRLSEEETSIIFDFWKAGDVESRESLREQFMNDIKEPSVESLSWYDSKLKDITEEPFGVFEALKYIKRESRVLCIGLDAGGKTTLLYRLKLGECVTTIPTIGFNVETIEHSNNNITVWDVGGGDKIRPLWRHYFSNCNAIIVVVDSNDRERLSELKEAVDNYILGDDETSGLPILFWANKQDLPNALPVSEITERLGLHSITQRPWYIQACCAITADGLGEGLDWLVSVM